MTRLFLFLFLFISSVPLMSQQINENDISIGKKRFLQSSILGEEREYWVYLPPDYYESEFAERNYPVLYVLDGDSHFHSITGIQQFMSKGLYAMIPEMIVVGILNTDRPRDYTPTNYVQPERGIIFNFPTSGGGNRFAEFLGQELIPEIDSLYRTLNYRILVGHSFGGLAAVNILLNHKQLFNAYLAIDPSMWWDNEVMIKAADSLLHKNSYADRSLYVAVANKIPVPQDTATFHPRGMQKFVKLLTEHPDNDLRWNWKYFEDDDHGSVPIPAEYYGLQWLFDGYQIHVKQVADNPPSLVESYKKLSKTLGFKMLPPEYLVNGIGKYCLRIKQEEKAIAFFEMNVKNYPNSPHANEQLAKAYQRIENEIKANESKIMPAASKNLKKKEKKSQEN